MSTFEVQDLDSSTEQEWRSFTRKLADRIGSGDSFAEFALCPAFQSTAVSGLEMRFRPTARGTIICAASGLVGIEGPWRPIDTGIHVLEKENAWADHVAALAVAELRNTWDIPHPSFLTGFDSTRPGEDRTDVLDSLAVRMHETEESLDKAVRAALAASSVGEVVESNHTGLRVSLGPVSAYVYIADLTEVRVHAPVVERIGGRTRAAELVADLNRRHPRLKFLLVEDRVHVAVSLDAQPFVPQHLIDTMGRLADFAQRVDAQFAENLGGVVAETPPTPDMAPAAQVTDDVPPQLMTLLQMDADAEQPLGAHDIVAVCGSDRNTITRYTSFCSEQAESWRECAREARSRGDEEGAAECDFEAVPWDRIVRSLRHALRTVGFCDNS